MWDRLITENVRCFVSRSWQVAWPMTLIMFFEFIIGLTDVFVAGRVGKDIQAAYGFVIQFYFIFIVVANALTVGTVSVVSRLFTSKDKDQLTAAVFSSLSSTAGAGIVFAVVGIFFAPALIRLLNIPAQVKPFHHPPDSNLLRRSLFPLHGHQHQRDTEVLRSDPGFSADHDRRLLRQCGAQFLFCLFHSPGIQRDSPGHGHGRLRGQSYQSVPCKKAHDRSPHLFQGLSL